MFDGRETFRVRREGCWNDRTAGEAAFDDFGKARVGRVQAADMRAIDARQEEHIIRQLAQRVEVGRREDIAVLGFERNEQDVAAAELGFGLLVGFDIRVVRRQ